MSGFNTKYLAKVGLLSAMATLLMFLEVPVPMMPLFLKLDISELPAIIAAFSLGPAAAVLVELIKNIIHAANTQTAGIGECANFLVGVAFLVPAGLVYRGRPDYLGTVLALAAGTISMVLASSVLNYYILLPLYQAVLHLPLERIVSFGSAANPLITDLRTLVALAIAPFNFLKGVVISLFTLMMYKKVLPLLRSQ